MHVSSLDLPPLSYKAGSSYTGFETELLTMLAGDLNLKVEFTSTALDTMVADLQGGRTDMAIGGLGITSTRENKVDFTRPFLCAGMSAVARDPAIQTRFDLENKTIAVLSGSTIQSFVQKLPFPKRAQVFPTANAVIYAVATGQVDASLACQLMEPVMAKLYPKSGVHFGPVQWSIPVGAMLPEHASSLRLALNGALAKPCATADTSSSAPGISAATCAAKPSRPSRPGQPGQPGRRAGGPGHPLREPVRPGGQPG